jgi:urease accessory protein
MMKSVKKVGFSAMAIQTLSAPILLAIIFFVGFLFNALPAMAHHAMDGGMPTNFGQGFLSGLVHPIIGLDHFAFIISIGLLAVLKRQGILIPAAFVVAAMAGTGLHLMQFNIPGVELLVSGSILLFGVLLVMKDSPNTIGIAGLASIAGLFHGYAYGESIFGAEMTPIVAYLMGFSTIQLLIAAAVYWMSKIILQGSSQGSSQQSSSPNFRSAGLIICGVGLAFLAPQLVALLLPTP